MCLVPYGSPLKGQTASEIQEMKEIFLTGTVVRM